MAFVTTHFKNIWRTKAYVGARRPTQVVQVRGGSWRRDYRAWDEPFVDADIPGETRARPWYPIFTETTPWVTVPNVLSCDFNQDFESNGINVATLVIDNVGFEEAVGPLGDIYHAISRGFLSPSRGYDPPTRPASGLTQNGWYDVLTEQRNIRIWQGYGEPELDDDDNPVQSGGANGAWVFNGLIDDVDNDSDPARMTVVARMGKTLTDGRVFGWNKSKQLLDPVIFADRAEADDIQDVGENAAASSELSEDYDAGNVLDDDGVNKTYWMSVEHSTHTNTEWVEIRVPSGRYNSIVLEADAGMELYIGVFVRALGPDDPAMVDGASVPDGFVSGEGLVPGAHGGWSYIEKVDAISAGRQVVDLGHSIVTGNDSVFRIGFRKLVEGVTTSYRARVRSFKARRRELSEAAIEQDWILVDDLSDVVRVVLRWAGYQEWEVEDAGTSVKGKMLFNRASYLIDIIRRCAELTGFVFFVKDPLDGESMGVPVFRRNAALQRGLQITEVRGTDLLTGLRTKRSEETLPYIIRVRGKTSRAGSTLGGDMVRRIMAVYRPPWTQDNTLAGVIKHVTRTDNALRSLLECQVGAYFIAIAGCLKAFTATAEMPGAPFVELDDQVGLMDTATGVNTRLWVVSRTSRFQAGEKTSWVSTLQGSLIDNPDLIALIDEIDALDFSPEPSPTQPRSEVTPGRFR
jgi:hypothetical protein